MTQTPQVPTIAQKTAGMQPLPGYFNLYWDAGQGQLWLEVTRLGDEFLYQSGLAAGIGSNDIGMDRSAVGGTHIVRLERMGPKILLIAENFRHRSISKDENERRAVRDSFAESALWAFPVAAEEEHRVLVDATEFFLRDAVNVATLLRVARLGNFRPEPSRCAIYLPQTRNFELNTEVESVLTFVGEDAAPSLWKVLPSSDSITVRQHHSLVRLPPPGYKPRVYDPRANFSCVSYTDYTAPLEEPVITRFIARHRLEKKDPLAAISEPLRPLVYYLDRGAPEPIRSALMEGAGWWDQAFEAAGFKNAFRVELMPEGADPMDLRYNVIQWVHRERRGWSFGNNVVDPRTGEIIKGQVTLDSLRVRQNYLIAEALLAPYEKGKPISSSMRRLTLARLRQLAAHEVGHTLGLEHNYSASSVNRSSVMDYPPPCTKLGRDGKPDLSDAYAKGIGEWDKVSITFGYQEFAFGTDERTELNKILLGAYTRGLHYQTDQDAMPSGSCSTVAHLWDSGSNAIDELNRIMEVRAAALKNFGENNIREGTPLATLEDVLVPLYMLHRYQVEAASKFVGGMDYTFAMRGDGQTPTQIVAPAEQRRALSAVLATLKPEVLALPEILLKMIPPRPPGYERDREHFKTRTSPSFDAFAPAEAAAQHALRFLFNPDRAARLIEFHSRCDENPSLEEVIDNILGATWKSPRSSGYVAEVARTVDWVALYNLMALSANQQASGQVRAIASMKLEELRGWLINASKKARGDAQRAHLGFGALQIAYFQKDPKQIPLPIPAEPPDGPPI